MSETTAEATTGPVRAFWPSDYKRFGNAVRSARKDFGDERADALAATIVAAMAADYADFDAELFLRSTYQIPSYVGVLSQALKAGTHLQCQPWTAAAPGKVSKVAALSAELAEVLSESVPGFAPEVFLKSVAPPEPKPEPAYGQHGNSDDDPEDDDTNDD